MIANTIKEWWRGLSNIFFPITCCVCGTPLVEGEDCICDKCTANLPRTNMHLSRGNKVERILGGKMPLVRASSFFYYHKGGDYRMIIHRMKYNGHKEYGMIMGRMMANELYADGFFDGVDRIIPMPLHYKKRKARGYNQSEWIAKGVAQVTGLPIDTGVVERSVHTGSQTRMSMTERRENVEGAFTMIVPPERLAGQHLLIIDDVLTTGATATACAAAFRDVPGVRISVLTLTLAQ